MDMEKKIQAKNWDETIIWVKMKDLHEWGIWNMYNRKHQIHPTQSEFTEAEFLPKHLRPSAAKQATTEEQH